MFVKPTLVNIHTHRRTGEGIEVVSVMAGHGAREAAAAAVVAGAPGAADLAGTVNVESDLPAPPFSIGVHPWQLARLGEAGLAEALREVEGAPACAIGEIGLDYAIRIDREEQQRVFAAQLRIARERRLPVVLHCVRAFEPVMEILAGYKLPAVVFHGFIGSPEQAARAVRGGCYLSMGERSLASPKTVEALRSTPLERLLLETDDAPVPIAEIYARTAEILGIAQEQLKAQIYVNYTRVIAGA